MAGQRAGGVLSEVQGGAFTLVSAALLCVHYILLPWITTERVFLLFLLMYMTISPLKTRACRRSCHALMPPVWVARPLRDVMIWDGLRVMEAVLVACGDEAPLCDVDRIALALRALFPSIHGLGRDHRSSVRLVGVAVAVFVDGASVLRFQIRLNCIFRIVWRSDTNYRLSVGMQSWQ